MGICADELRVQPSANGEALASALAAASRTGLLRVLAADATPKGASECAAGAGMRTCTAERIMRRLAACGLVERTFGAADRRGQELFNVPARHRATVQELGAVFETLLTREQDMEPQVKAKLVHFRIQKILSADVTAQFMSKPAG